MKRFFVAIIITIAVFLIPALYIRGKNQSTYYSAPQASGALEVLEHKVCKDKYGNEAICGIAFNNTGRMCNWAQIRINLYDSDGVQIGTTSADTHNLESGVKWKFEARISSRINAASYKIIRIDC